MNDNAIDNDEEEGSAAPWTRSLTDLWTSWKFKQLVLDLGEEDVTVFGRLHKLWHSQVTSNPTGELRGWNARRLAVMMGWSGKPEVLEQAMLEARFVVALDDGSPGYLLPKWRIYGGAFLAQRQEWAKKKKAQRAASPRRPQDVHETSHLREEKIREEKKTEEEVKGEAPAPPEPEVLQPETNKALEKARADVVRDNRNERNHKKAQAEAIYDRPQSVDALLAWVTPKGGTVGDYLAKKFPLFDDKEGRPSVADRVAALWNAFEGQRWGISGEDAVRWLVARLSEDYVELRQREHIIGEKKARGVTLPQEQQPAAVTADDVARWNDYCANNVEGKMPTIAQWREAGRPSPATPPLTKLQGSGGAPQLPPSSTAVNAAPAPAPVADDAVVAADRDRARAALDALADSMSAKRKPATTPSPTAVRRQMAREFARAALVAKGNTAPTDVEVMDHIVKLGGVDAIVDGGEGEARQ